jgi:hypothetical protein
MPLQHQLALDIPDTNNVSVFRVMDASMYEKTLDVKCATLQVTSPGFTSPSTHDMTNYALLASSFNLILNACSLGFVATGCQDVAPALPDGIYKLKYSVSPNDKVYVEYYHLRTTQTYNVYNQQLCKLEMATCEPSVEIRARLNELRLIKSYIDAAKIKAEDCHDPNLAMELLLYAKKRLDKYIGGCKDCNQNQY